MSVDRSSKEKEIRKIILDFEFWILNFLYLCHDYGMIIADFDSPHEADPIFERAAGRV